MKFAFVLPFVAAADVPLTMSWADWKNEFGMTFNGEEDSTRKGVFEQNIAFIEHANANGNSYTLGVNQFTHLTLEEFKAAYTGGRGGSALGPDDTHLGEMDIGEIASSVDWSTDSAVVNPVKDQGQCGSCWAFSAVGTVESAYAIAAGKLGSYSEQQLVDCSTNGGSEGCNGGFNQYGISYIGSTGSCRASSVSKSLAAGVVSGYKSVTKTNAGLQSALNTAPVSVTVNADNSWQSYRSGVLSESCGLFGQIDHAVIAVGYDTSDDTFKIRNSWGSSWGEGGYVRLSNSVRNPYCLYNTAPFVAQISADVAV
jgi:cathepsin L